MGCLVFVGMLSGSRKLVVGNNKEVWSQIDEKEQVMAADGGAGCNEVGGFLRGFKKKLTDVWWEMVALK